LYRFRVLLLRRVLLRGQVPEPDVEDVFGGTRESAQERIIAVGY